MLDDLPLSVSTNKKLYVFEVPDLGSLGTSESDYSNVVVRMFEMATSSLQASDANIAYFSTGKLGTLVGGLLNVADFRWPMSKEDVQFAHKEMIQNLLTKKRTGWAKHGLRHGNCFHVVWDLVLFGRYI